MKISMNFSTCTDGSLFIDFLNIKRLWNIEIACKSFSNIISKSLGWIKGLMDIGVAYDFFSYSIIRKEGIDPSFFRFVSTNELRDLSSNPSSLTSLF